MLRLIAFALVLPPLLSSAPITPAPQSIAQPPLTGTIRGTVYDSLGGRALAGATVELVSPARVVKTDQRGNFALDSVPVGANRLVFSAPDLDSIGLFGFARDLDVRAGAQQVTLATPSFKTPALTPRRASTDAVTDSVGDQTLTLPKACRKVSFVCKGLHEFPAVVNAEL